MSGLDSRRVAEPVDAVEVEVLDTVWIDMDDGCRLAAKVWLPPAAREEPVPAILEYIPRSALERLAARQTDTRVQIMVGKGTELGQLRNRDSYSYELANVYVGGRDRIDVLERYDHVLNVLQFEIEPAARA